MQFYFCESEVSDLVQYFLWSSMHKQWQVSKKRGCLFQSVFQTKYNFPGLSFIPYSTNELILLKHLLWNCWTTVVLSLKCSLQLRMSIYLCKQKYYYFKNYFILRSFKLVEFQWHIFKNVRNVVLNIYHIVCVISTTNGII